MSSTRSIKIQNWAPPCPTPPTRNSEPSFIRAPPSEHNHARLQPQRQENCWESCWGVVILYQGHQLTFPSSSSSSSNLKGILMLWHTVEYNLKRVSSDDGTVDLAQHLF